MSGARVVPWRTLLRLELGLLVADRSVRGVLIFFALVLATSAWLGGRHAREHAEAIARAADAQSATVAASLAAVRELGAGPAMPLSATDPRDPALAGRERAVVLAHLPPTPLASVSAGLRDVRSHALRVTTGAQLAQSLSSATALVGPSRQATGALDPAFVLVVLFPLVVIALSYDLLSGERERGTLALVLSQPVSQTRLVAAKAIARALVLLGSGVGTAWLGVALTGGELFGASGWPRTLAYTAGIVAYGTFWFSLAVWINARGAASLRNVLVLMACWLGLTVIVPGLLRAWVETRFPPPSRVELINDAREAAEEAEAQLGALEGSHGPAAATPADPLTPTQRAAALEEELARRTEPVVASFREQLEAQQRWVSACQYVSPAVVLQELLNDAAGTGSHRQSRFERQVDAFHAQWRRYFAEKVALGQPLSAADYAAMPRFHFDEEPTGAFARRIGLGLAGLLGPAMLLLLTAMPGLRRVGRLSP